ncbi:excinuclease ABC subunit C [Prosthecochloris sp. GSB1]|uniref:excinuclease ABC subunit UvrC n=1 Tax=Prosthecochloris sp. GSB1 TaxID=281093 RepID=UPI000B8D193F|nr:excinuclease ABC subunit UvrC [Prosthecochloris sp. GSB1]ASQ90872.1 excinuclease ABC subunit C [Prosthecochloris sp. GSB1]
MIPSTDNSLNADTAAAIAKKLSALPVSPGVYQFKNRNGKIIYVGKAKNLRSRVRSYFRNPNRLFGKTKVLVGHIADVEVIITSSEVEALILENNLIKDLKPRYNVNLKDDKTYPYLVITNEPFPRIFLTRQVRHDGSTYFGPYTEARQLRSVIDLLGSVFQIRGCRLKLDNEQIRAKKFKVCLDYHIHKCKGPCEGLQSEAAYNRMIAEVVNLLKGKTSKLVRSLTEQMHREAEALRFEQAAELKLQIDGLKKYAERQKVVSTDTLDRDVFAIVSHDEDACGVVFKIREGKLLGSQRMYFANAGGEPPEELLLKFLEKYYMETPDLVPTEIFTREAVPEDERKALESLLSTKDKGSGAGKSVRFVTPRKGEKARLLDMCSENARHHLEEYLIQKQKRGEMARENPALEALRKTLRLENPPFRIECFDNSHLQGTDYASSMVCFVDGKPRKSDYRKFRLTTFDGSDDYAAMKEAVTRRYGGSLSGELPLPDLVVVDGGKGQVNTAKKSLDALGLDIPVIGLAKRLEEIFLPGKKDPYNLPKTSPALKLLQHIRDEAHRFAISYHRNLRRQRTLETSLTEIPGIGEKTAMKLLRRFGSVEQVAEASEKELAELTGKKNAAAIRKHFLSHPERSGGPDNRETAERIVTIP